MAQEEQWVTPHTCAQPSPPSVTASPRSKFIAPVSCLLGSPWGHQSADLGACPLSVKRLVTEWWETGILFTLSAKVFDADLPFLLPGYWGSCPVSFQGKDIFPASSRKLGCPSRLTSPAQHRQIWPPRPRHFLPALQFQSMWLARY